ncbi:hypothetical protein ACH3XW_24815 [Acanthocheilonema viteae]
MRRDRDLWWYWIGGRGDVICNWHKSCKCSVVRNDQAISIQTSKHIIHFSKKTLRTSLFSLSVLLRPVIVLH